MFVAAVRVFQQENVFDFSGWVNRKVVNRPEFGVKSLSERN